MDLLFYFAIALILTWSGYRIFVQATSQKLAGKSTADLVSVHPELAGDDLPHLVFLYSKSCGPCRAMKPYIDALAEETNRVVKIDLSEHSALARKLGIRAVPTTLAVQGGLIRKSLEGLRSKKELETLLKGQA